MDHKISFQNNGRQCFFLSLPRSFFLRFSHSSYREVKNKMQVNETNTIKIFLYMHQIFDVKIFILKIIACVHYFYFYHQNNLMILSKMIFIVPKKLILSSRFSDFCTSFIPFFPILGHCRFCRRS